MHPRHNPSPALLALAARQDGILSTDQIEAHGLGRSSLRRLVAEGRWRHVCLDLYLVHDLDPSWTARAWGGILIGGQRARLSGEAAAHLWGLQDEAPDPIAVLVPHERRLRRDGWVFQRELDGIRAPSTADEPPRTTVVDTVIDRGNELDADAAVGLVLSAVQQRRLTTADLRAGIERRPRVRHRHLLLDVVSDATAGAESKLEWHYLRDVERAHGLPTGRRQARGAGGSVHDVAYDRYGLVVELDGRTGHEELGRFRDMARDNRATVVGQTTLRYGWFDVTTRCCAVAGQVVSVLVDRGWTGLPTRCSRCRSVPDQLWGI